MSEPIQDEEAIQKHRAEELRLQPEEPELPTAGGLSRDETRRMGSMSEVDGCLMMLGFTFLLSVVVACHSLAIEYLTSLLLGVRFTKGSFILFAASLLMALLEFWAWDRSRRGRGRGK